MNIRTPRSSDEIGALADVAEAAFGANALFEPWRNRYAAIERMFGREVFLGLEVDGRWVSSCTCLPASVWVGDRRLTLGAVGGVATLPDNRNRGYAGALMCAMVRHMQEHGLATSALWPFSFAYYRKFGWDFACEHRVYRFSPDKIDLPSDPGDASAFTLEDLPGVSGAFERYARGLAFCTDRTEPWWREMLRATGITPEGTPGYRMLACRDGKEICGYAIYRWLAGEEPRIGVGELVALSLDARLRLLSALAREEPREIIFRAPLNDCFRSQISNPRHVSVTLEPGFSFRVVDPAAALSAITPPGDLSGALALDLRDPARPEAPLRVVLTVESGRAEAISSAAAFDDAPLRLSTDIPTFSQIFAGVLRPHTARAMRRVEADTRSLAFAERVFPHWTAYRSELEPG